MDSIKQEAIKAITKLPDTAEIDDIMYRLYVIDKIRKGQEAIKQGKSGTIENLKREVETW